MRVSAWSRRDTLRMLSATLLPVSIPSRLLRAETQPIFKTDPFALGVASGYPTDKGIVLWTRLVDETLDETRGNTAIPVTWEIASDERMSHVVRSGIEYATAEWGHSLHVEIQGLKPEREYWYRFHVGGHASRIGRTHTAPAPGTPLDRLRIAVASCQQYESGYYTAYRHMLDDELDLVVHVGDYIYEYQCGGDGAVRGDGSDETRTLADYRARYATYRKDADLQDAHAMYPWLVTWDDHEVANDYSGERSYEQSGAEFLARRTAAYRAYYENMPLPHAAKPVGAHMRLYTQRNYGDLLNIIMLDTRQYRSWLACLEQQGDASCTELFVATRTKLGKQQEAWLSGALKNSRARWNVLAQGTPMMHEDLDPGPGVAYRRDQWDGYPAARQRLLDSLAHSRISNPVVVDGDLHAFQVAGINARANDIASPVLASEFTTTSISSHGFNQRALNERLRINPNLLLADSSQRGYLLMEFARDRTHCDLVTVDTVTERQARRGVMARYVVENGKPGPIVA